MFLSASLKNKHTLGSTKKDVRLGIWQRPEVQVQGPEVQVHAIDLFWLQPYKRNAWAFPPLRRDPNSFYDLHYGIKDVLQQVHEQWPNFTHLEDRRSPEDTRRRSNAENTLQFNGFLETDTHVLVVLLYETAVEWDEQFGEESAAWLTRNEILTSLEVEHSTAMLMRHMAQAQALAPELALAPEQALVGYQIFQPLLLPLDAETSLAQTILLLGLPQTKDGFYEFFKDPPSNELGHVVRCLIYGVAFDGKGKAQATQYLPLSFKHCAV